MKKQSDSISPLTNRFTLTLTRKEMAYFALLATVKVSVITVTVVFCPIVFQFPIVINYTNFSGS